MKLSRALRNRAFFISFGIIGLVGILAVGHHFIAKKSKKAMTRDEVSQALGEFLKFPDELELALSPEEKVTAKIQYTFEPVLQKSMEQLFRSYRPDYGAFVALDATTGRVLSMVSYSWNNRASDNLALRATFPSASVFKVVTAAAAIEGRKYSANTVIPFNGQNHTLYRGNILKTKVTRWTRYTTLKEAFARSINTVFGKIGAFTVGPDGLREYADRFGFNRKIAADLPIQQGRAWIPDDSWGLAESASGFTRDNTMSPLQGALIASAIANDGMMMEPFVVEKVLKSDGVPLYSAELHLGANTVDPTTAEEIRSLMRETITHGTSSHSFRGFFRKELASLDVGGKTGSLTGRDPRGKYDWFVGYAKDGTHRIAVAALTIHERLWRVKSSYLARKAMETYFKDVVPKKNMAYNGGHDSKGN